ncbi:MAG: diguanylate cyclase [Synechococcales cyanobacterium C42_A2020_086]|jgi:two-component system cell cycle response regulator|nr:diguanylate cyclase [Synechococcales cyanobacterium C42_A2020_086]
MDASILLVGGETFRFPLLKLIRDIATFTVEVAADPLEAMPLILAQQPDLLLIEANQKDSLELCRQIKSQSRLAWIYCIVIEDCSQQQTRQNQEAPPPWEQEAEALEAGADAYLNLPLQSLIQIGSQSLQNRRLQAQLRTGLRQVQNHRELMRTNDVLSAIALSDPLTELNNRRAFEWELPRQIQNARNRSIPISLIMLDVDFFKVINDTHGHLIGDRVLKFLAARLRHNLRLYDTPFRYGGEEFVIILSNTDRQEALLIANRLCQLIGEQPFAVDDALDLTVTISVGAATLRPEDDAKGNSLLQRADQRLLQAKAAGRNRVVG